MDALQLDELAVLLQYHSGRKTSSGHLMPDAVKRIGELWDAIAQKHADMGKPITDPAPKAE